MIMLRLPTFIPVLLMAFALAAGAVPHAAEAATRVVKAQGAAAMVGNDTTAARKGALAEALYDAAGRTNMSVRGASHLSTQGVATEDSTILVQGKIKDYQVVDERREGNRYIVVIEALIDSAEESCKTGRRFDLELRHMRVRVAPGLSGHTQRLADDSVARALETMQDNTMFRIEDRRSLYTRPDQSSPNSYMSIMQGVAPAAMIGGYTMTGDMVVERTRRDNIALNTVSIKASVTLRLQDVLTGQSAPTVQKTIDIPVKHRIWGTDNDIIELESVNFAPLWDKVIDGLEEMLGCQPLRARVMEVSAQNVRLSVGNRNGIKAGDYFLVEFPGQKGQGWQLMVIESTGNSTSVARLMKKTPNVPLNATAVLMQ